MVIFLVGLVSMILMRTLRKDYARYSKEEEMDDMVSFYRFSSLLLSTLLFTECRIVSKIQFVGFSLFSLSFCEWWVLSFSESFCILSLCTIRTETWEMNTGGNRYMEMCFGRQAIHWSSRRSSAPAARSSPSPSSSSSSLWLRICTQSE